jgi:hypothetical protein
VFHISKPGSSTARAEDQREIWFADQAPKCRDKQIRTTTASAVAHMIPESQHGHGFGSAHCETAHLVLRASFDRAKCDGLTHSILFIDRKSAFATTRREFLVPTPASQAALQALVDHGANETDLRRLTASPDVGEEWGAEHEHLRWLLAARAMHPWASFDGRAGVLAIGRGLAAGFPLADVMFCHSRC